MSLHGNRNPKIEVNDKYTFDKQNKTKPYLVQDDLANHTQCKFQCGLMIFCKVSATVYPPLLWEEHCVQ